MLAAMFMAGAFLASPELRVYAANTIGSADIIDGQVKTADLAGNAVTAAKIKDGEVKAAELSANSVSSAHIKDNAVGPSEIAANAVGASELQGVSKIIFNICSRTFGGAVPAETAEVAVCPVPGVSEGDVGIASITSTEASSCLSMARTETHTDQVLVRFRNTCSVAADPGSIDFAIVVFDT